MERKFILILSIFACLVLSSCSDEFGCMHISYSWCFYLPEKEASLFYETYDSDKTEMRKYPSDKEGYDAFVIQSGEDLHTRRNYTNSQKAYIEYVDGTSEIVEPAIEIAYLDGDEKQPIFVCSNKYNSGIECYFSYIFFRSF